MSQTITCPKCGNTFEVTEAFSHHVEEKLRSEFEKRLFAERTAAANKAKQEAEQRAALELKDLRMQNEEKDKKLREAQSNELELRKRQREIEEREKNLQLEVQRRLEQERKVVETNARQEVEQRVALELKDLRMQNEEKDKNLREAQSNELELRKRQREIEERERNLQLEMQRKLDAERAALRRETEQKLADEHRLKDAEKDRKIAEMLRQIEEMKRKIEQGSQQAQGEVLEVELENLLRATFRTDDILPVPKGIRGADVVQRVKTPLGNFCGVILWESKRTKNWNDGWIQKLKEDQRDVKANVAAIVSTAMPEGIKHVGNLDGVWICDFAAVEGLALALRSGMVEVARARASAAAKGEKSEHVYTYLVGQEFRQRVEGIVESYATMKEDLDAERRTMEKLWARREQQIQRGVKSIAGMYGDLEGIIGSALQPVAKLELPPANLELFDE